MPLTAPAALCKTASAKRLRVHALRQIVGALRRGVHRLHSAGVLALSGERRAVLRATLRQTMHVAAFLNFKALQVACERLLRREAERVLTAGSPLAASAWSIERSCDRSWL